MLLLCRKQETAGDDVELSWVHVQSLAEETNAQQQTVIQLQKRAVVACNDQLKELCINVSGVQAQVRTYRLLQCLSSPSPQQVGMLSCISAGSAFLAQI